MAKVRLSENFIEEFEEIIEKSDNKAILDTIENLLDKLKEFENEIKNTIIDEQYINNMKEFSHVDDNGYIYKFENFRLVCLLEEQTINFIGIFTIEKIIEMFGKDNVNFVENKND